MDDPGRDATGPSRDATDQSCDDTDQSCDVTDKSFDVTDKSRDFWESSAIDAGCTAFRRVKIGTIDTIGKPLGESVEVRSCCVTISVECQRIPSGMHLSVEN